MSTSRIIALVDMDCFYVQVEEKENPSVKGKPAAVVQYNKWKGGGIIAVNYEARDFGVSRNMRGDDAKAACPEIKIFMVPETRGKADLTKYREAGREVINVLTDFSPMVERASIDEAYIDLTEAVDAKFSSCSPDSDLFVSCDPQSIIPTLNKEYLNTNFVMGQDSTDTWLDSLSSSEIVPMDQLRLALGAEIVGKMREAVYDRTGYRCSAGIAHNKILAKLACGINKPNKQTVLPHESISDLWKKTKTKKVRNLGGKLGDFLVEVLHCEHMIDLLKYTEKELANSLGSKTAGWLYQLARGYDDEVVTPRQLAKSIGCNKNFLGPEALFTKEKTKFWIQQLSTEVVERIQKDLEMNNRKAKVLTLHIKFENQNGISRSCGVPHYNMERMATDVFNVVEKLYQSLGVLPINSLGLIASKFEDELDTTNYGKISKYFSSVANLPPPEPASKQSKKATSLFKKVVNTEENISIDFRVSAKVSKDDDNSASCSKTTDRGSVSFPAEMNSNSNEIKISETEQISPSKTFFTFKSIKSPTPKASNSIDSTSPAKVESVTNVNSPNKSSTVCERCGKSIFLWDFVSHTDYHFAKDLQREINGLPPLISNPPASNSSSTNSKNLKVVSPRKRSSSPKKRVHGSGQSSRGAKRGRSVKSTGSNAIKTKTLDAYFTPKT